jgi:hypothetical protein
VVDSPRRRHRAVPAALLLLGVGAAALAWTATAWWLLAVPFCLVGAYGAFLGLSATEVLDAVDAGNPDAGRGVPGMLP